MGPVELHPGPKVCGSVRLADISCLAAQEDCARGELRARRKAIRWIVVVFPQIAELGRSETTRFYSIPAQPHSQGLDMPRSNASGHRPRLHPRLSQDRRDSAPMGPGIPYLMSSAQVEAVFGRSDQAIRDRVTKGLRNVNVGHFAFGGASCSCLQSSPRQPASRQGLGGPFSIGNSGADVSNMRSHDRAEHKAARDGSSRKVGDRATASSRLRYLCAT